MNHRRYPIGAEPQEDGSTHFRVWAPRCARVEVVLESTGRPRSIALGPDSEEGYFSAASAEARPGTLYRFRLDGADQLCPDPAARFQPDGPHGPSQVVAPRAFRWSDDAWQGIGRDGQVIYEMHIGTLTPEGTWAAAERELPRLAETGITILEVMPVADFPGRFGWGYDGVNFFAPTRLYGTPDDFRRFVDAAHAHGIGVILDVVYNHFGPDGNYLKHFSDHYFSDRHENEWGDPINFDGPGAGPVREFFLTNAAYWIDEFHLDGLRLDATQQIFDASTPHILTQIGQRVRAAAGDRKTFIVAENEPQESRLVRPVEAGGYGLDALWNDDFHHSASVALTGRKDAYYCDYLGKPQEFISAAKWGFLFQGQRYSWQKAPRGQPTFDLAASNFVSFIENHDQVANSLRGERIRLQTSPGRWRAMTALFLLGPATPMLFQGQEYGASNPFFFFADHHPELAKLVAEGRRKFLGQFAGIVQFNLVDQVPEPQDAETFLRSKLDPNERGAHPECVALHQDLLKLRRNDPAFNSQWRKRLDGAVLGADAFVLRYFVDGAQDRLLIANLGRDSRLREVPEPLLAPPEKMTWSMLWSSEDGRYGGSGHGPFETDDGWHLPGEAVIVLEPIERSPEEPRGG